jgi:pimeloyl-ACP methyl ester carboxylesterase
VGAAIDELLADMDEPLEAETGPGAAQPSPSLSSSPEGGRAVVVGHSLGGRVAVCLAARRPELVDGLVLAGVPLLRRPPGKPQLPFRVVRRLHRWRLVSDGRMEAWRQRYGSADYVAAQGIMRQVLVRLVAESYERQLSQLEGPVALVWGELDTAAPLSMARRAAGLIPTPHTFDVAEGVGHDVHTERPELLRARITELAKP